MIFTKIIRYIFLLSILLLNKGILQAQNEKINEVLIKDSTNKWFFINNPDIKQIWIIYENNQPSFVTPLSEYLANGIVKGESYNLNFKGDSLIFYNKYKDLNLSYKSIPSNLRLSLNQSLTTIDSVKYIYKKESNKKQENIGTPASIINNTDLIIQIEEQLKLISLQKIDSTIVFSTKITKDGKASDITLEYGKSSKFSDLIYETIFYKKHKNKLGREIKENRIWKPAVLFTSGQNVITKVRIYVSLDQNGKLSVITTPKFFRFLAE